MKQTHKLVKNFFQNFTGVTIVKSPLDFSTYLARFTDLKFVLCSAGNGIDTHRFYETVLMRAIPIVESSALNSIYKKATILVLTS